MPAAEKHESPPAQEQPCATHCIAGLPSEHSQHRTPIPTDSADGSSPKAATETRLCQRLDALCNQSFRVSVPEPGQSSHGGRLSCDSASIKTRTPPCNSAPVTLPMLCSDTEPNLESQSEQPQPSSTHNKNPSIPGPARGARIRAADASGSTPTLSPPMQAPIALVQQGRPEDPPPMSFSL